MARTTVRSSSAATASWETVEDAGAREAHRSLSPVPGRRVRVVQLAARLPVGGMETVVAHLYRGLSRETYEPAIWCLEEADRQGRELRGAGAEVVELGRRHRRDVGLFFRIASLARQKRIDILHCHDELSWFYGTIAASLARIPRVVVTVHGRRKGIRPRHVFEQRLLALRTSTIVSVSDYLRRELIDELRVSPRRLVSIPNGVRLPPSDSSAAAVAAARRSLGVPPDATVVGCVAGLSPVKNFEMAIDAFAEARHSVPSLQLVFVGDGAERDRLRRKVAELALDEVVHFTGMRRDVDRLWPGLDIYVCSSNYEGMSLSVLEAMTAGRAVIATAVGGNPELVTPNETGVLVPPRNPRALAAALVALARDPVRRSALGRKAQILARRAYAVETMVSNYDRLYRRVLGQR